MPKREQREVALLTLFVHGTRHVSMAIDAAPRAKNCAAKTVATIRRRRNAAMMLEDMPVRRTTIV